MIISHKHKFIFIKTRKTAGTSFEIALGDICGSQDIISRISLKDERERRKNFRGAQNYRLSPRTYDYADWRNLVLKGRLKRFESHDRADKIVDLISDEHWDEYFKFCFERNPWDKMVSHYFWKKDQYQLTDFDEYWKRGMAGEIIGFKETVNTREQYSLNGKVAVDKIYQFEDMNTALKDISSRLSLNKPLKMPNYKAKGGHRSKKLHYQDFLTEKQAADISALFKEEIKLLKYTF